MKKEILLTSLIMMNPVANLQAKEITEVRAQMLSKYETLANLSFVSSESFDGHYWTYNQDLNDATKHYRKFKWRIEIRDNSDETMTHTEDELKMEYFLVLNKEFEDGYIESSENEYRVDRLTDKVFKLYNCDSTLNCQSEHANTEMILENIGDQKILLIKNLQYVFSQFEYKDVFFVQVNKNK
ncbi:hypothetical protein ACRXCV_10490 [Halobacteriovorax sp. GFR7]|uniref:hypothetical protein n=1 Tax=unclassified Halobacteriovorax TaxID=2639665 RepID=UPI003D95EDDF